MRYRNQTDEEAQIDISPLIDMVFILLIFFMVTTTFVKDMKLDLERPSASSGVSASTKAIRVFIDTEGDVYVDNQQVRIYSLQSKLRDMLRVSTDKSILVVTMKKISSMKTISINGEISIWASSSV